MTNSSQHTDPSTLQAAAAPHVFDVHSSTRRMMLDVLLALLPAIVGAIWFFRAQAVRVILLSIIMSVLTEVFVCRLRHRRPTVRDLSVLITGVLLALSLPPSLPSFHVCVGAVVAVALGKLAFGGLGQNVFNPAMVGRAFLMISYPVVMTQWTPPASIPVDAISSATALTAAKFSNELTAVTPMVIGFEAGSLGETSVVLIALGGLWMLWRGAGDWRLTVGMLLAISAIAVLDQYVRAAPSSIGWLRHLSAGGVMLAAFFIVTDPVTTPLSKTGRWCFGVLVGVLTMVIRLFAGYPEGVMFAVLLGNAVTPLINRWTMPQPVGGRTRRTAHSQ